MANLIQKQQDKLLNTELPNPDTYMTSVENPQYNPTDYGPLVKDTKTTIDVETPVVQQHPLLKINKYEKSRIIGARATQLSHNAPPLVDIGNETDPVKIALMEYNKGLLKIYIVRKYPNGDFIKVYPTLENISDDYPILDEDTNLYPQVEV
jgi:DNA-directed RNA polymerase subunit K/omega